MWKIDETATHQRWGRGFATPAYICQERLARSTDKAYKGVYGFGKEFVGTGVGTGASDVQEASELSRTAVGIEVRVSDRFRVAQNSSVRVNYLNVSGVLRRDARAWSSQHEERKSWIQSFKKRTKLFNIFFLFFLSFCFFIIMKLTNDVVYGAFGVIASESHNVSSERVADEGGAIGVQASVLLQKVYHLCDVFSHPDDSRCRPEVRSHGDLAPVNDDHVEVIVFQISCENRKIYVCQIP